MTRRKSKEIRRENSITLQRKREFENKMCGNKVGYGTEIEAYSAGKFAFKNNYFRTYICPICGKWHLTTKEKKRT